MNNVLVCVTRKETADILLKTGSEFVTEEVNKMYIVHIGSYEMYYINKTEEEEDLDYLYEKALEYGGDLKIIRSNNVPVSLSNFIKEHDVKKIIIEDAKELRGLKRLESLVKEELEGEYEFMFVNASA